MVKEKELLQSIKSAKRAALQSMGIISLSVLIGYPLGYIRDMLLMKGFGAGSQTDAWIVASQIPDLFFKILLFGALGASFIPVFTEFLMQKKENEAWAVACTIINFTVLTLGIASILAIVAAPFLISVLSPGFSIATQILTVKLTRIVFPIVLIFGVSGLITAIYHAHLKFSIPAFTNLLNPVILIIFIVFLSKRMGILSLAYGTIAGALLSLLILAIFFIKKIKPAYKFKMDLKHPAIKGILILMIPLIGADLISKGGAVIWRIFASFLEEGSITYLTLAGRLISIPTIIFSSAAATVIFPLLSRQKAQGDIPELKNTLLLGIKMMSMILLPAVIGFMVIGKPIVRLLFERGLFDAAATQKTANVLFFLSFGILADGLNPVLYKTCYALKKNWYLFRYETIGLALTIPLLYIFLKMMGLAGIALSGVLIRAILVMYLLRVISKELGGLNLKSLRATFYKVIVSSVLMGIACRILYGILSNVLKPPTLANQIIQVGSPILLGAAFYFGLLFLFRVKEVDDICRRISGKIKTKLR